MPNRAGGAHQEVEHTLYCSTHALGMRIIVISGSY